MTNEEIIRALTVASAYLHRSIHKKEAHTLLKLRDEINKNGTPSVWSNRKAFRRYQGQGNTFVPKTGYAKYRVIMIEEEEE